MTPRPAPRRGSGDTLAGPRPLWPSARTGRQCSSRASSTAKRTSRTTTERLPTTPPPAPNSGHRATTAQATGSTPPRQVGTGYDYATLAYNAVTGTQLWVRRYNFPDHGDSHASAVTVSSSGVFVTGYSQGATTGP